ncbi:uncharacterized protein LOC130614321 [Hydractinia symbiolongicarpus]|uniref:uncharacterized protein LOC130614321 n=1 Tax=Hydractinia symbiolongicarpus TaxID=13093 RepID=UPI00254E38F7|nr:uncharacterized protein LOC130614321 [Hydractinia symbiolongicarpus]
MAEVKEGLKDLTLKEKKPINPILRTILQGVADENCPFSKLTGMPHIVQMIWQKVLAGMRMHIKFGKNEDYEKNFEPPPAFKTQTGFQARFPVKFPEPTDININMMPFIMDLEFENTKLPDYLEPYFDIIETAFYDFRDNDELGKVGYLTIHESLVEEGTSQRRPGLHTESPGVIYVKNKMDDKKCEELCIEKGSGFDQIYPLPVWWGKLGYKSCHNPFGGIYMASTVDDSCEVWDCQIEADNNGNELIRKYGDIEHLRSFLPESTKMKANVLYWITDRTPHESLPIKKGTYRQFFRLVTHKVSVWYEDHSTKNPNGVVPDPKMTRIVKGSKFDKDYVTVIG